MFLKSFGTFDSSLLDVWSLRIVVRLLFDLSVVISILARKIVLDVVGISYFVIDLIVFKMRRPPDIIFSSISILLILRPWRWRSLSEIILVEVFDVIAS